MGSVIKDNCLRENWGDSGKEGWGDGSEWNEILLVISEDPKDNNIKDDEKADIDNITSKRFLLIITIVNLFLPMNFLDVCGYDITSYWCYIEKTIKIIITNNNDENNNNNNNNDNILITMVLIIIKLIINNNII